MARKAGFLSPRKAIYVFWEGESEEVYTKYLKKRREASGRRISDVYRT